MKKLLLVMGLLLCLLLTSAYAYDVVSKSEYSDAVYYTISCNGGKARIKYLKSNGGWYVAGAGASNYNYGSMDAAARAACKYAK